MVSYGTASFLTQANALLRKNIIYQRRNIKQNIALTIFPAFLCLLIISIQSAVNSELQKPRYQCGCKCIDAIGTGTCQKVCGMEYSTSIQAIACPVPSPQEWPALMQVPSMKYRAVKAASHDFPGLPNRSCFKDLTCPVTSLFTGQNETIARSLVKRILSNSIPENEEDISNLLSLSYLGTSSILGPENFVEHALLSHSPVHLVLPHCSVKFNITVPITIGNVQDEKEVDCLTNLYLWRESSTLINAELFQGYRKGNSAHRISEYVGAYDFQNTSKMNFNINLWYNSTHRNTGKRPLLLRIPRTLNMVSNAFLRQFKSSKMRVFLSYVKEMPKPRRKIAMNLSEILGPLLYVWIIQLLLPVFLISLVHDKQNNLRTMMKVHGLGDGTYWIVIAFLAGNVFSNVHSAAGYIYVFGSGFLGSFLFQFYIEHPAFSRKTLIIMEIIPGFSLYRGLYELSQFALEGHYRGTHGMQWKDLNNHENGIKEVLVIMVLEWLIDLILLYISYYLGPLPCTRSGSCRKYPIFRRNLRNGSIQPTAPMKIPSSPIIVDQEETDVYEEQCRVEKLLNESTASRNHPIICNNLEKIYIGKDGNPNKQAVYGLSLTVAKGECLGMLGPSGSGKTTVINMVIGLLQPTSGTVFLSNKDVSSTMDNIHAKIGICPQKDFLWDSLSGREHLMFYGRLRNLKGLALQNAVECLLTSLDLHKGNVGDQLAGTYSGGMKRRLSVAISLVGDTQVVLLDEPATGLDPDARNYLWHVIKLAKRDRAIILTTHSMEEAEFLCDRLAIIVNGRLRCLGSSSELKTRYGGSYKLTVSADPLYKDEIEDTVTSLCSDAMKIYDVIGTQRFRLPKEIVRVHEIFEAIEILKRRIPIHAFELTSASLEDVFSNVVDHALGSETD